jgi:hypothetical protein
MLLEPMDERKFFRFHLGRLPRRSAYQPIKYICSPSHGQKVAWVLEVDLGKFFDAVDPNTFVSCRAAECRPA